MPNLHTLLISLPMLICFFWGIFFFIRCFQHSQEPRVQWSILLFYIAATILYFDHWLYFSGIVKVWGEWSYGIVNLCVYPLYYTYLRALTRVHKGKYELLILFAPALIAVFLFPIGRYTNLLTDSTTFLIIRICFTIQVLWVLIRGYRLLLRTIKRMDDTYSDDRSRLLHPTRISLVLFGATAIVSMVLNFLGRDHFAQEAPVAVPAIVMSILLYGLGFIAAHTTLPKETVAPAEEEGHNEEATTEETDELMYKIATTMREQKLYADPRLTIQDLATAVNSNRTYVSKCINRSTGFSFSQYVARYRVENAQSILRDPQYKNDHEAIAAAIALSGFTSDQTFYRSFKEVTGLTPLQYRKSKG